MNSLIVQQFLVLLLSYVYSVPSVFYMKLIGIARNQPVFLCLHKVRIYAYNFLALFKYQILFYICRYALTRRHGFFFFIRLIAKLFLASLFLSLRKVRNGWARVIHHTFNVSRLLWKCSCQPARKREKGTDRQTDKKDIRQYLHFYPAQGRRMDGKSFSSLRRILRKIHKTDIAPDKGTAVCTGLLPAVEHKKISRERSCLPNGSESMTRLLYSGDS